MAATYEIITQVPRTRSEPGGQFSQVIQVTFRTKPSAQVGMIDIPATMYTAEDVDRIISLQADLIEKVQHL